MTFWQDRPVLVTGATGLLGGWLLRRLIDSRASVVCLVRDWVPSAESSRSGLLERSTVVRGDVRDPSLMERVLGEYEIDTVYHLAAQTIVSIANRNPVSTFETNIVGTAALLESCRRSPTVRQIVVASSDKAYGSLPLRRRRAYVETDALAGEHPYDVSKSCADLLARAYAKTYGLCVAVTRCGNLYGGGDLNWNRIIPGTIRSVIRGQRPVIRSDGTYVRDYFYVEDAVEALILLAERLSTSKGRRLAGEAFNFSNEKPMSVIQVVGRILRIMESDLRPVIQNKARHEIPKQYLNAQKARRLLGWRPACDLDEGLRRSVGWYRDFFSRS